jgi:hypothetical protein
MKWLGIMDRTSAIGSSELRELARAVEAGAVVRALEKIGLTQKTLAWATGANERSVRNWRTTSAIRPEFDERLREVQEIALLLEDTLTPRGIAQWFTARNRLLNGRRPVDAVREGNVDSVRQAAVSFAEGGYV